MAWQVACGSTPDGDRRMAGQAEPDDQEHSKYRARSECDALQKAEEEQTQIHGNHCAAIEKPRRDNDGNTCYRGRISHRSQSAPRHWIGRQTEIHRVVTCPGTVGTMLFLGAFARDAVGCRSRPSRGSGIQ